MNKLMKLIMEATKAKLLSRVECYTLCDLIMIKREWAFGTILADAQIC